MHIGENKFRERTDALAKAFMKKKISFDSKINIDLSTNLQAAQPFIKTTFTSFIEEKLLPSKFNYHVTQYKKIPSIIENALDPKYGGKNGAAEKVGNKRFVSHSKGKIHASINPSSTHLYIDLYEVYCDLFNKDIDVTVKNNNSKNLGELTIVLRIPKSIPKVYWSIDFDDHNAYTTSSKILPKYLEALTTEGWVPISSLVEINKSLGQ